MCNPPFSAERGGVEPTRKLSKRGEGLTGSQFLEGGCWERVGSLFSEGERLHF